jgi:hypothetical protein
MARMTRMTAVKTPSPYRRSLWMVCVRYVDGTVGARQPPVCCTVVTVYGYGGQPYIANIHSLGIQCIRGRDADASGPPPEP